MSYDRDFGFICDDCGDSVGGAPLSFMECKFMIDTEDWKSICVSGTWEHYCPNCKDKH